MTETAGTYIRHLRRAGTWQAVLTRLGELTDALEAAPPPIDYQTRRWACADQSLLVAAVNRTREALGPVHGRVSTHLLTEVFWQVYTGGDLRLAAPTTGTMLDPDLYHDDEEAHLNVLADPELARFLATAAAFVASATGTGQDEPLTWQPPSSSLGGGAFHVGNALSPTGLHLNHAGGPRGHRWSSMRH